MKKIRHAFGDRVPVVVTWPEEARGAKQEFRDECDINRIMARYEKSGLINFTSKVAPRYEFVPAIDFQQSMEIVKKAEDEFYSLPSKIRNRFANDPVHFLEFVQDPENIEEARKLGLLPKESPPQDAGGAPGGDIGAGATPTAAQSVAGAQAASQAASGVPAGGAAQ